MDCGSCWELPYCVKNGSQFFLPTKAIISCTLVWVRLPSLPIELFDERTLMGLGNLVDRAVKVD